MPPDEENTPATGDPGEGAKPTPAGDEGTKLLDAFKAAGIDDPAKALETIQKLRPFEKGEKLPAKVAKELEDLRAQVKEHEDSKKSEGERLSERLASLERAVMDKDARIQELTLRGAFTTAAAKAGALYPEDVYKLADGSKVEYDDGGNPTNLEAMLEEIRTSRPALFGKEKPTDFEGGARTPAPGSGPGMNDLLRAAVKGT